MVKWPLSCKYFPLDKCHFDKCHLNKLSPGQNVTCRCHDQVSSVMAQGQMTIIYWHLDKCHLDKSHFPKDYQSPSNTAQFVHQIHLSPIVLSSGAECGNANYRITLYYLWRSVPCGMTWLPDHDSSAMRHLACSLPGLATRSLDSTCLGYHTGILGGFSGS